MPISLTEDVPAYQYAGALRNGRWRSISDRESLKKGSSCLARMCEVSP